MTKRIFLSAWCLLALAYLPGCLKPRERYVSILAPSQANARFLDPDILTQAKGNHLALLRRARDSYKAMHIRDYTCTFIKQETLSGRLGAEQQVAVKFMPRPFSIAMKWTKNPPLADRLIYVQGRYKNAQGQSRMLVRPKGGLAQLLVGKSVLKLPDGPDAMRNTLRPCTKFGFENGLASLIAVYELAEKNGDLLKQDFLGITEVGGRKCIVLRRVLANRDGATYPAKTTEICLDTKTLLPMRIVGYDWDNKFSCNYEFRDVKFNTGLAAQDFTPRANGIAPPKNLKK
jgi:hypothetical protein